MAWRNIWRNKRRTFVILTAVFIGVTGMIFLAALMKGMVFSMVDNSIANLTGHVLIRNADFVSDPSVDNRLNGIDALMAKVKPLIPADASIVKRIKLEAMINTARDSYGVTAVGTDIALEKSVSFIGDAEFEGERPSGEEVMIGRALSEKTGLGIGKRLVVSMQGADGDIASASFRIKGIFRAGQKQLEESYVFIPYDALAKMLGINGAGTEISIHVPDRGVQSGEYDILAAKIRGVLAKTVSVMSWREVMPAMNAYLSVFDGFMLIWYIVIFMAMGFGIVNTVLMAVYERMREFGLLRALGLKRSGVFKLVIGETSALIATGLFAGNLAALILIWIFSRVGINLSDFASGLDMYYISRIIYPVFTFSDLIKADVTVFVLGVIIALYPAVKACGFTPVRTMRNV